METRYKLKSLKGLFMIAFAFLFTTNIQAQALQDTVVACDEFTWINGDTYTGPVNGYGLHDLIWTDTSGSLPQTYLLNLTILDPATFAVAEAKSGCQVWIDPNGVVYDQNILDSINALMVPPVGAGNPADVIYTVDNGVGICDSSVTVTLTLGAAIANPFTQNLDVCNEYTDYSGYVHTKDTVVLDYIYNSGSGCLDPTLVNITWYSTITEDDILICDTVLTLQYLNGNDYHVTENGIVSDSTDSGGIFGNCLDIDIIHWTVTFSVTHVAEDYHHCGSDPYVWNGIVCDAPGDYNYSYTNDDGCASIATLTLSVGADSDPSVVVVADAEGSWDGPDGNTYTESDYYFINVGPNSTGCDSVVTFDVTINPNITGCTDSTSCNYNADATEDDGSCNTATIVQSGDVLTAETNNGTEGSANWYNKQGDRTWLMAAGQSAFSPTYDCTYFVIVTDENGCGTRSADYLYTAMAARIGTITTYPNPAKDVVSVRFNNYKNQNVTLELIDNNGNKVDQFITPNNELDIDLSKYPSGVYYISFDATNNGDGCMIEEKQQTVTKIILNK